MNAPKQPNKAPVITTSKEARPYMTEAAGMADSDKDAPTSLDQLFDKYNQSTAEMLAAKDKAMRKRREMEEAEADFDQARKDSLEIANDIKIMQDRLDRRKIAPLPKRASSSAVGASSKNQQAHSNDKDSIKSNKEGDAKKTTSKSGTREAAECGKEGASETDDSNSGKGDTSDISGTSDEDSSDASSGSEPINRSFAKEIPVEGDDSSSDSDESDSDRSTTGGREDADVKRGDWNGGATNNRAKSGGSIAGHSYKKNCCKKHRNMKQNTNV